MAAASAQAGRTATSKRARRTVYVLELTQGKYYVGVTAKSVEVRFLEHVSGAGGSAWTSKFEALHVVESAEERTPLDENNKTKELMAQHGIDNVRGGTYTKMVLSRETVALLRTELRDVGGACRRCGRHTHFVGDCYARTSAEGTPIAKRSKQEAAASAVHQPAPRRAAPRPRSFERRDGPRACSRCGRASHASQDCYARSHADGRALRGRRVSRGRRISYESFSEDDSSSEDDSDGYY